MNKKQNLKRSKREINEAHGSITKSHPKVSRIISRKKDSVLKPDTIQKIKNNLVVLKDENKDGLIVLKQESLYRPLLIVFGIQLFVMMIVFPNIFDDLWPEAMTFIRNIISWMALSATGTLLPIPGMSPSDYRYILDIILDASVPDLEVFLIGLLIVCSDTLFAFFGYKFADTLRKLFMPKTNEVEEKKINDKFRKSGNVVTFLGAATPFPFTLTIYAAGALKLPQKGFLIAVFTGRLVKYFLLAFPIRMFNFDLVEYGESLWNQFISGNLVLGHYIIIFLISILVIWLIVSILKSIMKKRKLKNSV